MAVEKLSISFDAALAAAVRQAAESDGVGVSSWLADAAAAKVRHSLLAAALRADAAEAGDLSDEQIDALAAGARRATRVVGSRASAGVCCSTAAP